MVLSSFACALACALSAFFCAFSAAALASAGADVSAAGLVSAGAVVSDAGAVVSAGGVTSAAAGGSVSTFADTSEAGGLSTTASTVVTGSSSILLVAANFDTDAVAVAWTGCVVPGDAAEANTSVTGASVCASTLSGSIEASRSAKVVAVSWGRLKASCQVAGSRTLRIESTMPSMSAVNTSPGTRRDSSKLRGSWEYNGVGMASSVGLNVRS